MKLGEIKIQSLMLIFPSESLEYGEDNVAEVVFNLKSSRGYAQYLAASVGAINRALSIIESHSLSGFDIVSLESAKRQREGDSTVFDLSDYGDISSVRGVYLSSGRNKASMDFYVTGKRLYVKGNVSGDKITVEYLKKIEKITHATDDNREIAFDYGIEEQIPYFVKADLILSENQEESNRAREIFENAIARFAFIKENSDNTKTVYSLGGDFGG